MIMWPMCSSTARPSASSARTWPASSAKLTRRLTPPTSSSSPAASIHTHMELPFGGTQASDDFHTGTVAAAHGGTTTIIDFAVQYKGQSLTEAVDNWHKKAEGKTVIDYGFHLITTELEDNQIEEMYKVMDEGITSFKLFMAYPGVFLVDDATIFRAMSAAGERGGLICMHAENGIVINEIIKHALAKGHTAPKYHALTRPTVAEA